MALCMFEVRKMAGSFLIIHSKVCVNCYNSQSGFVNYDLQDGFVKFWDSQDGLVKF